MSLLNLLLQGTAPDQSYNGGAIGQSNFSTNGSRLHYTYSINGVPLINDFLDPNNVPSELDLNGVTPSKYTDNLPG